MSKLKNRKTFVVAGESGQGVNSIGEMLAMAFKRSGFFVFGYREYPSLIQGGYANYQIDFGTEPVVASSRYFDIAACLSRLAVRKTVGRMAAGGILIHCLKNMVLDDKDLEFVGQNNIKVIYIDAVDIVKNHGGSKIMVNTFFTGILWRLSGLKLDLLEQAFRDQFAKKPEILAKNLQILDLGYSGAFDYCGDLDMIYLAPTDAANPKSLMLTGNHAISLGAISAGVRAYYAYPMTPSSSILTHLADSYDVSQMLVKQAEDEITAIQMTLGSMHMGTRALVATSGGGYDLMTESVSFAAIAEIPLVCVLAQRPGPATGLPTWTSAADLNLAVYAGHGEYTRCVLAASDVESCYILIQKAYDIAEKFQIPVILLTEKQVAESHFCIEKLPDALPINRYLFKPEDPIALKGARRFEITDSGISPRWLPGQYDATYNANSDEHFEHGRLTEDSEEIQLMMDKRLRKQELLVAELPDPELYGEESGDVLVVGWGSVKNSVLDAKRQISARVSYLHYEYVYPIKANRIMDLKNKFKKVVIIENNATAQLAGLIKLECGFDFELKLLKYNGSPFFVEDVVEYIDRMLKFVN